MRVRERHSRHATIVATPSDLFWCVVRGILFTMNSLKVSGVFRIDLGMQLPRRNKGITITAQSAEKHVGHDIHRPYRHIGTQHFALLSRDSERLDFICETPVLLSLLCLRETEHYCLTFTATEVRRECDNNGNLEPIWTRNTTFLLCAVCNGGTSLGERRLGVNYEPAISSRCNR